MIQRDRVDLALPASQLTSLFALTVNGLLNGNKCTCRCADVGPTLLCAVRLDSLELILPMNDITP